MGGGEGWGVVARTDDVGEIADDLGGEDADGTVGGAEVGLPHKVLRRTGHFL